MNKRIAVVLFVLLCVVVVILLATHTIRPVVGGVVFAASLLILGALSGGFRNDR